MKYLAKILILLSLVTACTSDQQTNNSHSVTPTYEASPNIEVKSAQTIQEIEALTKRLYPVVSAGEPASLLAAIAELEGYALNLENLKKPEMNHEGNLHPAYRRLIDL